MKFRLSKQDTTAINLLFYAQNRLRVMTDSSIIKEVTGKSMKKKIPLLGALSVYEILRLCFILAVQAEYSDTKLPLSWYLSVPLLVLPFFLLYTMYKNNSYASFAAELYGIIKIAGTAGFIFFINRLVVQSPADFPVRSLYVFKTLIYMMPFFVIDVILSVFLIIKNYRTHEQTEGELCK